MKFNISKLLFFILLFQAMNHIQAMESKDLPVIKLIGSQPDKLSYINSTLLKLSQGSLEEKNAVTQYCYRVADTSFEIPGNSLKILREHKLINKDGQPFEKPCWMMDIDRLVEEEMEEEENK